MEEGSVDDLKNAHKYLYEMELVLKRHVDNNDRVASVLSSSPTVVE